MSEIFKGECVIYVDAPRGERLAGRILDDNGTFIFCKKVKRNISIFRKLNAWSIQYSVMPLLEANDVIYICFWDDDDERMYRIKLAFFKEKCLVRNFGNGTQCYVNDMHFETYHEKEPEIYSRWVDDKIIVGY
jgi:hypothetical protein